VTDRARELLSRLELPIVLAPLAGGPATVDLAVAVADAGALGFLAAGYQTAEAVEKQIEDFRRRSSRPLGVNLFSPPSGPADPASYSGYVDAMRAEAERLGVQAGEPRFHDDEFNHKVEVLLRARPEVASFAFGCPAEDVLGRLRQAGLATLVTVTTPEEAEAAAAAGAGGLIVQGYEAGGHRGSAINEDQPTYGVLALLALTRARTELPLVAAGGIATGRGVAAVLAAGAEAAQIGTAFLLTPEAGTTPVHREAIASGDPTAMTRAFTGKPGRGVVNRFIGDYGDSAPPAYPELHYVTAPLRVAARKSGDPDPVNLWAGQTHELARAEPVAEVVRRLAAEAREAADAALSRLRQAGGGG
jgi:nitronate monooxygenase